MRLGEEMARLRGRVDVAWNDERAQKVLAGVPKRAARKRRQRVVAASLLVAIAAIGAATLRGRAPLGFHSVGPRRPMYASVNANVNANANDWRALADARDWQRAYDKLRDSELRDQPDELLLAAEVLRKSGHPNEALPPLKLILDQHARSPRAAQAAMAYGRVLLDDLRRPREAAVAFAQARALPGHQGVDEDALAREAEAWWKAGDRHRAEARAREYLRRFPDGAQLGSVRRPAEQP